MRVVEHFASSLKHRRLSGEPSVTLGNDVAVAGVILDDPGGPTGLLGRDQGGAGPGEGVEN